MKYIFFLYTLTITIYACGWVNGTTIDGYWVEHSTTNYRAMDPNQLRYSQNSSAKEMTHFLNESFSKNEKENNITKAVLHMLEGKYEKTIQMLLVEEKIHKNSYEVAINLGTAYELHGDNHNALKWIKEGIKRNPNSHHDTEWLHVQILETKILLEKDPHYLKRHSIVNEQEIYSDPKKFLLSLFYQLRERMLFVKPQDPIVADLLYSYAIANAHNHGFLEYSTEALEMSEKYGYLNKKSY